MINFSIKRPVLTFVSMLIVILLGAISIMNIPLQLIPNINPPIGVVVATYPDASPEEVNQKVTIPLEDSLATTPGLESMTSTSQEGSNLILMQFSWSTNVDDVENDIMQAIDSTVLPDDVSNARFLKFDPSQLPIINMSVSSNTDAAQFQSLVEDLQVELEKIDGVASVSTDGLTTEQIEIELDSESLNTYNLDLTTVGNLLRANHLSIPGVTINEGSSSITTRISNEFQSIEDIEEFIVTINPENGDEVTMDDIATIEKVSEAGDTITRTNQEPSVLIDVLEEANGNTSQVSRDFNNTLNNLLEEERFSDLQADVLFDQGDYINRSIKDIAQSLILGAAFAMIVLFIFLRNFRSPIIIGISIPYSVVFTFVLIYFSDFSLNLLTMGGLALGVGMLVDNSIIVIENINRYLSLGKSSKEAAYLGAKEVSTAILASTLTTIAVFLPVVFIDGIIGQIFKEFSITIAFSLLASLFVALTVVPMLASKFMKVPNEKWLEKQRRPPWYSRKFRKIAHFALRFRILVLGLVFILMGLGFYGIYKTGMIFLPETDEGFFSVNVDMQEGTNLETTRDALAEMETYFEDVDGIETYLTSAGVSEMGLSTGAVNTSEGVVYITMTPADERSQSTNEIADSIKADLESIAQSYVSDAEIQISTSSSTGTDSSELTFNLTNDVKLVLEEDEVKLRDALSEVDGFTSVTSDLTQTVEEVVIELDQAALIERQLSAREVSQAFNDSTQGLFAFSLLESSTDEVLNAIVTLPDEEVNSIEAIGDIVVSRSNEGEAITLDDVGSITRQDAPTSINRIDGLHAFQFTVQLENGLNLSEAVSKLNTTVDQLELDESTELSFTGDQALIEDSINDMIMAMILAVLLVYFVMAAQFESFKYPFVIMITVPLSVIGVMIALFVTNTPLSVPVFIGILVLIGIVVNNGIVLVDFINQYRESGKNPYEAIIEAVSVRARPILMTAMTTMLALVPIAIGLGDGSEINQPMGISVIGGLFASTLLSLVFIPVIYSLFTRETLTMNFKRNRHKFDRKL